jgi:hypothetical protein
LEKVIFAAADLQHRDVLSLRKSFTPSIESTCT